MASDTESVTATRRALPVRNLDNQRFFDSCAEHRMELQKCAACARFRYFPAGICPYCGTLEYEWSQVSGLGTVYSFTWVYRPAPGFEDAVPYAYALVELDEGPVKATNIVNTREAELKIGLPVRVHYEDVTDDVTLPLFEPAARAS